MNRTQQTTVAAGALALGAALLARGLRAARAIDFRGRSVLVTGGSRGLGLLVGREFAQQGAHVMLAARDNGELERARDELARSGLHVEIATCDVSKADEAQRLVEGAIARFGSLDALVNNAGVITVGPLEHMLPADFEQAMAVHFWGPLYTTMAVLPHMRGNRFGRIVNVSSIGGKIGVPHLVPYCASKFALTGLSDSVRAEVAKDGVAVTTVCPGLMRTGSPFNAWFKGRHRDEFTWFAISDSLPVATIDAERAAAQIVDACRHGDPELVISWPAKLAVIANGLVPEAVALAMQAADRFILPDTADRGGEKAHSGWQSLSNWAPSRLTRLTDRAAERNNELPH
jgi:NAD(P)-dependent dehydrogenase (short-subunit alcohol dehydrogenase family)